MKELNNKNDIENLVEVEEKLQDKFNKQIKYKKFIFYAFFVFLHLIFLYFISQSVKSLIIPTGIFLFCFSVFIGFYKPYTKEAFIRKSFARIISNIPTKNQEFFEKLMSDGQLKAYSIEGQVFKTKEGDYFKTEMVKNPVYNKRYSSYLESLNVLVLVKNI